METQYKRFTSDRIAWLIVSLLLPGPWTIAYFAYCVLVPKKVVTNG